MAQHWLYLLFFVSSRRIAEFRLPHAHITNTDSTTASMQTTIAIFYRTGCISESLPFECFSNKFVCRPLCSRSGSDFDQCVAHVLERKLEGNTVAMEDAKSAVPCGFHTPTCALHNLYPLSEGLRRRLTDDHTAKASCMILPEEERDEARRRSLRSSDSKESGLKGTVSERGAGARGGVDEGMHNSEGSEGGRCGLWKAVSLELTRAEYEDLCGGLFDRGLVPVTRLLDYLDLTIEEIDEVVMVGGMTRTPKVRELLKSHLGVNRLNIEIDPDVVVAYGAATIAY